MKHLKLFFALFAMLALGVGNAWAQTVTWEKATSIAVGDVVALVCESKTMELSGISTTSTKYGTGVAYTSAPNGIYELTVEAGSSTGTFSFKNGSNYLYWSSGNSLNKTTTKNANASWTVTFSNGNAVIKNAKTSARQIYWNASSPRFACYDKTGQTAVQLYKKVTSSGGGSGSTEPVLSLTDEQLKWSAATATALKGAAENAFPNLTNTIPVPVTYGSSNTSVATIDATTGAITLVASGTTTISAAFAGGEVSGTKYAAKTVNYTLTVKQLVSCADIYTLADDATFVLKDIVVTYVNGDYTYIKDATGYGVIYKNSYGLQAGDQVASGKLEGKKDTYKGLVEIIPTTTAADLNATPGTAPEPEVMTNTPTNADINKYVKFENVSFKYTNLNDTYKTNSGKLEGQTEYNIAFYNKFTSNVTFDTSKKYDVVGVVSIKDDAIEVYFISAEEVEEPTLNVKITNADFGKIAINDDAERTLTLNGSLLTNTVSLAIEGEYFTLASNEVTPIDGNIAEAKIKIYYQPTVEGTHIATLKITSEELSEQTITLTGQAAQQYTVKFFVNGEEQTDLAKKVLSGNTLDELPEATSCDQINYPTFAGWASDAIANTTDVKPTMLDLSTPITNDCKYYAVFEKATVGGSSEEQTETINAASFAGIKGTAERVLSANSSIWTWNKGSGSNIVDNDEIRLYANHTMTISKKEGCDISKIVVDINTGKPASDFAGNLTGATMSLNENTAILTPTNGDIVISQSAQSRVNSFVVTYTTSTTTYEYITSCAVVVPTCEITYEFDGGEGECTTDIVEKDTEYTLCATAPTKTGHTFLNWKDQNETEYAAGATINSVTEDLTLTAQWQVNSYEVTWMSLGDEVLVNNANYNTQPTKPTTDPTYTCGADKEFVGWTTQEIDGVGVPANLYTDEFPVVTEAITYHAVFAGKSTEATTTTSTLLVTEKLGNYASGSMKDDLENVWNYYAGGFEDAETYYLALRNNSDEISYIESPKFVGTVQSIAAYVRNGSSSKARTVYLRSSAVVKPTEADLGTTSIPASNNSEVALNITSSFDKFYIQVSEGLQFHKIVVTSGVAVGDYIDYTTSCPTPEVIREGLTVGQWGTLCPKQNVDNPTGATFYQIAYLEEKDDLPFNMHFDEVEGNLEAGQPYFFIASATEIKGVKSGKPKTEGSNVNGFYGYIGETSWTLPYQASFDVNNNNTFVIWNNSVFRINAETSIKSERCYININSTEPIRTSTPAPVGARRITMGVSGINGQNTATGVDQVQGDEVPTKMIINGQLFILRGEKMYDAQGKLVK